MKGPRQSEIISSIKNEKDADESVMTTTKAVELMDNIMSIVFASVLIPLSIFFFFIYLLNLVLPLVYAIIFGITMGAYCSSKYFDYAMKSLGSDKK